MGEISIDEFAERLRGAMCSLVIRDIMAELCKAAETAGEAITRAHVSKNGGWGITYKRGKRIFCRFDPKPAPCT